ncbi:plasmid mobilization relaxosome protein MobC, partial [Aeromonas caviae]|uniref:plasmid mobilization relaxosome protein MobC n=1 Tax=Aeromonas caviae TaxID=648 RepID=UPI001CC58D8A
MRSPSPRCPSFRCRAIWFRLARTAANLNQIARHLNEGQRGDGERIGKALGLQLSA